MKRKLDVTTIRNAKIEEGKERRKLSDGGGLFLLLKRNKDSSVTKSWRYTYRLPSGKQDETAIGAGQFPNVTLADARVLHDEARALVSKGINPRLTRKASKKANIDSSAFTLEAVAREWLDAVTLTPKDKGLRLSQFERFVFPHVGCVPIADVQVSDIMDALKRIVSTGVTDTHMRVNSNIKLVFDYAWANGKSKGNPAAAITPRMVRDAMPGMKPHVKKHYPALHDPVEIGALLRAIDGYEFPMMRSAMQLSVLIWQRPSEIRKAEWVAVDFERLELVIPARNRKLPKHLKELDRPDDVQIVPLAKQAIAVLKALQPFTGNGRYVFQSTDKKDSPFGETTLNNTLQRLGFKGKQTGHGFRHMASTALNGMQRWGADVIEAQLSHKIPGTRGDYNHSKYLETRREMMQAWGDYLDVLRAG
jgi:integrase